MPLNRREVIQLASLIEERRRTLIDELRGEVAKARAEQYGAVAGEITDIGDQSVADLIADLDQAEVTRDLGELRALEAARERIAAGSFGRCADCGGDIGFERLRAEPGAARCLECQQRFERTHRAASGGKL